MKVTYAQITFALMVSSIIVLEIEAVQRLRFRSTTTTTISPSTTPKNDTSTQSFSTTIPSTPSPQFEASASSSSSALPSRPYRSTTIGSTIPPLIPVQGRRRRTRTRRIRRLRQGLQRNRILDKRQGEVRFEESSTSSSEEPINLQREALYDDHRDNYEMPDHYYSPIKRQRQKAQEPNYYKSSSRLKYQQPAGHSQYLSPTPTAATNFDQQHKAYHGSQDNGEVYHNDFQQQQLQNQPPPKNYAFAYAVRDDANAEDFSHKEARDGKLTMGEYRINLPDGRVQVVRYTAGGTIGYKADVTYEGDDPRNKELTSKPQQSSRNPTTYYDSGNRLGSSASLSSPVSKKYRSNPNRDRYNDGDEDSQQYIKRPSKSRKKSPTYRPKIEDDYYNSAPSPSPYNPAPSSAPSPTPYYGTSQRPSSFNSYSSSSSSGNSYNNPKSIYDKMSPSPSPKEYTGNLAFLHEKSPRAGPSRGTKTPKSYQQGFQTIQSQLSHFQDEAPQSQSYAYKPKRKPTKTPAPAPLYNEPGPGNYYTSGGSSSGVKYPKAVISPSPSPSPQSFNYIEDNDSHSGGYTPIHTSKSPGGLIPIEHFKAGPSRGKKYKKTPTKKYAGAGGYSQTQSSSGGGAFVNQDVRYKEPFHYYNSQHPSYHHGGYSLLSQPSPTPPVGMSQFQQQQPQQQQPDPSLSSYSIDYPGGKHSFTFKTSKGPPKQYLQENTYSSSNANRYSSNSVNTNPTGGYSGNLNSSPSYKPQKRINGRKKKTSSGLVYLETPGLGPRPTQLGVKDILSRLPNMPENRLNNDDGNGNSKIHPYEVGSKDYGNSVAYKNSFNQHQHDNNEHHDEDDHHHDNNGHHYNNYENKRYQYQDHNHHDDDHHHQEQDDHHDDHQQQNKVPYYQRQRQYLLQKPDSIVQEQQGPTISPSPTPLPLALPLHPQFLHSPSPTPPLFLEDGALINNSGGELQYQYDVGGGGGDVVK